MKLLFAIKSMSSTRGGAERVLADITSGLAEMGHDIAILTYDTPQSVSVYPVSKKIKQIALGIGDTKGRANALETLKRMRELRRTICAEKPDIVIAFMHSMFIPLSFALIGTNITVIASEHIVPAHYKTRKLEFLLLCLSSFFVRRITVLSETVKNQYPWFMHHKMHVIANPVTPANPADFANPAATNAQRKIILNVGRLDAQKDQKTLIAAFAMIAQDFPDWDLRIIGEGNLRPALEEQIRALGLRDRIFLAGATDTIGEEYKNAHIFALSSLYESFGLATAEAMAHGLPALGFADCTGTNELIIDGENGFLCAGDNRVHAFAESLTKLMSDPDLRGRLSINARTSSESFHPHKITLLWQKFLEKTQN